MSKTGNLSCHPNGSDEEINIFLMIKKTIAMKVKRSETIKNLKKMLYVKEGISEGIQDLFFTGDRLMNGSLIDYGIDRGSTLHLIPRNPSGLKLFVKMPTNETPIVVEAMAHHSVRKIKSLIQAKEGVASDQFTLIYDGNILEEDMTLGTLNITSESKLHLVFCSRREVISISVKIPAGEILKLKVKVLFTIDDVKEIVGNVTGVCSSNQILTYEGMLLEDRNTLAFYDIKEASMLVMSPSLIQIFVKTPTQEIVKLKVKVLLTFRDVKAILANMSSVSIINHDLFYGGMRLEDFKTLSCYDIKSDDLLDVQSPASDICEDLEWKNNNTECSAK